MTNTLKIVEQNFENFIPLVKECYPNGKLDKQYAKSLVDTYQKMTLSEDVVIALYDHTTASIFFISENIEKLTGFNQKTIIKWRGLLLFKILHYSHYSYAFSSLRLGAKFTPNQAKQDHGKVKIYCSGLKIVDAKKNIKRVFIKGKQISTDEKGQSKITVFFGEEITHLVKSSHYWFRLECQKNSLAYTHQKGKKVYEDIISSREQDILKLLAQNKSSQEIADILFISKLTVETHRKNMIKRIGAVDSTAMVHLCKMANLL